jgi:predicted ATPase
VATNGKTVPGISFGPFFLDPAGRRLFREGRRVPVSPIELKLLETLLRNRERVLTGQELRLLVWAEDPSAGVAPAQDANTLYVAVRKLRRALGDYGRWIVNIPKVGYAISEEAEIGDVGVESPGAPDDGPPFVGRRAELDKLKKLLANSRLITLVGPPGIGKSRLAARLADEVADDFPGGTYAVNLVPVENDTLVPRAVLSALALVERADRTEMQVISEHLKERRALLVIDNCEHLIDGCSHLVEQLLRAAPQVRLIAASREPLLLSGESVMAVPPLSVPGPHAAPASNGSERYDAVELFLILAKQRRPDFEAEERGMALVGELCRLLEGIPLAIELAAVQVGAYTVEQIIEVMSDRFRLLRGRGGEDLRHRTLEDAVDWSYSLLTEEERILLRRLSVFAGGWTVETAREVCAGDGVEEEEVIHLLAQLVRRSLVQHAAANGRQRYVMLETIRQFGRKCLRQSGEEERTFERHARYFLELAENAFEAGGDAHWLTRTEEEYDNVQSVLERSIREGRNSEMGLRLCGALAKFWFNHGHFREAKFWTRLALEADDGRHPEARARALRTAGFFFGQLAGVGEDSELGKTFYEQSIAIWHELGVEREEAFTLGHYAFLLYRLGLLDDARRAAQKSLELSSATGDQANIARSANNLSLTWLEVGEFGKAKPVFEIALSAARLAKDKYLEALSLHYLGETTLRTGELDQAKEYLTQSLSLFEALSNRPLAARTQLLQGEVASSEGDFPEALKLQRAALQNLSEVEDTQGIASALEAIACTLAEEGRRPGMFLTLIGAAAALRRNIRVPLGPARGRVVDRHAETVSATLDEGSVRAAEEKGRTMSVTQVVEFVLGSAF